MSRVRDAWRRVARLEGGRPCVRALTDADRIAPRGCVRVSSEYLWLRGRWPLRARLPGPDGTRTPTVPRKLDCVSVTPSTAFVPCVSAWGVACGEFSESGMRVLTNFDGLIGHLGDMPKQSLRLIDRCALWEGSRSRHRGHSVRSSSAAAAAGRQAFGRTPMGLRENDRAAADSLLWGSNLPVLHAAPPGREGSFRANRLHHPPARETASSGLGNVTGHTGKRSPAGRASPALETTHADSIPPDRPLQPAAVASRRRGSGSRSQSTSPQASTSRGEQVYAVHLRHMRFSRGSDRDAVEYDGDSSSRGGDTPKLVRPPPPKSSLRNVSRELSLPQQRAVDMEEAIAPFQGCCSSIFRRRSRRVKPFDGPTAGPGNTRRRPSYSLEYGEKMCLSEDAR